MLCYYVSLSLGFGDKVTARQSFYSSPVPSGWQHWQLSYIVWVCMQYIRYRLPSCLLQLWPPLRKGGVIAMIIWRWMNSSCNRHSSHIPVEVAPAPRVAVEAGREIAYAMLVQCVVSTLLSLASSAVYSVCWLTTAFELPQVKPMARKCYS